MYLSEKELNNIKEIYTKWLRKKKLEEIEQK